MLIVDQRMNGMHRIGITWLALQEIVPFGHTKEVKMIGNSIQMYMFKKIDVT
jgi:hypothetical protein